MPRANTITWFNPGKKVYWRGRWWDQAMVNVLVAVEKSQGWSEYYFQGSYNAGVDASAGTHNKGGVYDGKSYGLTNRQRKGSRGVVPWPRTRAQGFMVHDHALMLGASTGSWALKSQMYGFIFGQNGLAGRGRDDSGVAGPFRTYPVWQRSLSSAGKPTSKPKKVPTCYIDGVEKSRKYGKKVRAYYSVKLMQRALNKIYAGTPLKEDGILGPVTLRLFNRWRRANFGAAGGSGSIGATSLKLLFKRAKMRVQVKATPKGKVL